MQRLLALGLHLARLFFYCRIYLGKTWALLEQDILWAVSVEDCAGEVSIQYKQ